MAELSQAFTDVLAERVRHVEVEGWTPEHDDEHRLGVLALAGAAYAVQSSFLIDPVARLGVIALQLWPWRSAWWKPTTIRRCLVKAAALIIAEIERLDRAEGRAG